MNLNFCFPIFLVILSLTTGIASAQDEKKTPIPQRLQLWNAELERSSQVLAATDLEDNALKNLRTKLTEIRDGARAARDEIEGEAIPLRDELGALGPPPAEEEPKEPANIARNRKNLNDRIAAIEGRVKEAELVLSHAEKALKQLAGIRIDRFTQKIFSRGVSALSPEVWQKAIPDLDDKLQAEKARFGKWRSSPSFPDRVERATIHLIAAIVGIFVLVWPFTRWLSRNFGRVPEVESPTYLELLRAALAVASVRILLPMTLAATVYWVLDYDIDWGKSTGQIAFSMLVAVLMIIVVNAMSRAMLSPSRSRWRLMPLDNRDARYIHKVIVGLVCVFAVDLILDTWLTARGASLELTVLRKFLIGVLIAALLLALVLRRTLWRPDADHSRRRGEKAMLWRGLRGVIAALALTIPVSAIAGYVAFSRLLGTQIVLTGGLYILVGVLAALFAELIEELFNKETAIGAEIRRNLELDDEGSELVAFWVKGAVSLVVYVAAALTLLVIWGAGGEDLSEWLYKALFGFEVAGVTISIATIFLAIALFAGILLLTRLIQRFLELRILPRTRIDFGIQNSIRASVGYIGFIVAVVFAISTLGIDLTKLAIIAGALSVGIGFGLQNVVNNFVSGLILLIERPIKVGDWVVIGDKQGYVKKIKVRATEIQTFDRASVFIPNSDLISNPLLNWTHADKTGRVIVPVGVAYGTDTQRVHDILIEVASAHPAVFRSPAPSVMFKGFGDSCLNFELRAFVQDVDKVVSVNSELCFQIDAAFRKEGIEIPYPQQDIHWRDIERIENLVAKILGEKKP